MTVKPRGRKKKYAEYDDLLASLPKVMTKRPKYIRGIGVFRGSTGETAWVKINLRHGGEYKGKSYKPGHSLEIKLGSLSSWSWEQLDQKHQELQGKADRAEPLEDAPQLSFKAWVTRYLSNSKDRLRSYETIRHHIEKQFLPRFGSRIISDITTRAVNDWSVERLKSAKPATVKRELATLKVCLNAAIKEGFLEKNPCEASNAIRGVIGRQRFLSPDEMLKLLEVAENTEPWMADLILWYLHSGMRKSEALGLLWSDIRELPGDKVVVELRQTKADKSRHVPCTKTMVEILGRQKGRKKDGDQRLFPYPNITIRRRWDKIRDASGLDDIVMHDLRRTSATMAVVAGVDMRTLQGRLGHSDLSMLQKHYAALVGSAQDEAAEKIEAILAAAK